MQIKTKRLLMLPFTTDIIRAASQGRAEDFTALGIVPNDQWPESDLKEALPHFSQLLTEHGITGYNSWLILDRCTRESIGSLGFLSEPDANGSLEMGFGIIPDRQRNGYCAEAARALIEWAESEGKVQRITAHCEAGNRASRRCLAKLRFKEIGIDNGLLCWELVVSRNRDEGVLRRTD